MKERRRKGIGDEFSIVASRMIPAERERAFMGGRKWGCVPAPSGIGN